MSQDDSRASRCSCNSCAVAGCSGTTAASVAQAKEDALVSRIEAHHTNVPKFCNPSNHVCLCALSPLARDIGEVVIKRLHAGQLEYGEWHMDESRDMELEVMEELMDALVYGSKRILELRHNRKP